MSKLKGARRPPSKSDGTVPNDIRVCHDVTLFCRGGCRIAAAVRFPASLRSGSSWTSARSSKPPPPAR